MRPGHLTKKLFHGLAIIGTSSHNQKTFMIATYKKYGLLKTIIKKKVSQKIEKKTTVIYFNSTIRASRRTYKIV